MVEANNDKNENSLQNTRLTKNVLMVAISNIFTILAGVLTGFVIPKIMGVTDHGYYKIFTLYISYVGLFHFGFIDGIYLLYAGKNYANLDKEKYKELNYQIEEITKEKILYEIDNYKDILLEDLGLADEVIFIINYGINNVIKELATNVTNLTIITNIDLENINVRVIKQEVKTNAIIIDHKLIWYGEINPFSYNYKDIFSIIRLEDRENADTIIKEVDIFR